MLPVCEPLGLTPSFGFGDRTGLATPGHVAAMKKSGRGIAPIFAQQSIREMARTNRTAPEVMRDAVLGAQGAGWSGPMGADADHLKTPADIDVTAAAGFVFFTLDPSGDVDPAADTDGEHVLRQKLSQHPGSATWLPAYTGRTVPLDGGISLSLTEEACLRAAVKYGRAIQTAIRLSDHIATVQTKAGRPYEIELSVDETDTPTTLAEHFIIASECLNAGMRLVSLAPRFVGDFEKGVDFKGSLVELETNLNGHAAVARTLGPYKISLHSGSDKLSMYGLLARATGGQFHVKTAGTSYLEALRVLALHESDVFRSLVDFCRERYETDKATYHLSAVLADVPAPSHIASAEELIETYVGTWETVPQGMGFTGLGRQILHCTFGSVLTHPEWGQTLRRTLETYPETYSIVLSEHFCRHLDALNQA